MRNIILFTILLSACSPKQEIDIDTIVLNKSDSINSDNSKQVELIKKKHLRALDSLENLLSKEKMRTATDLNLYDFENYIKHHCVVQDDSIRIMGAKRYASSEGQHVITFMDYNLNSRFHSRLLSGYRYNYNKIDSISSISKDLKNGHWLKIKKYNKYNYAFFFEMCEYMLRGFTISDSLFVTYNNMDESDGSIRKINSISSFDGLVNINDGQIILTPTDANPEIYVFNEKGRKSFIVHESSLNKYPIIVQDCHELGASPQYKFVKPE